jgi:hypothetical protein
MTRATADLQQRIAAAEAAVAEAVEVKRSAQRVGRLRELWPSMTPDQRREPIGTVMGPITVSRAGGVLDPPLHRKPTTRELFAARFDWQVTGPFRVAVSPP